MFVTGCMANGGAERVISVLANSLIMKYSVYVLAIFEDKIDYELNSEIKYIPLNLPRNMHGMHRNIYRTRLMRNEIKRIDPDIIVSFLSKVNIFTVLATVNTKYKLILSERNDPRKEPDKASMRFLRNVLYYLGKKNYFVFQTAYAQECFGKKIQKRSKIIFNPIKPNLPNRYSGEREKRIVTVARLDREKNISMLIEAFSIIKRKYPEYILEIYGQGFMEAELKRLCIKLKVQNSVFFRGFCKDVHEKIVKAMIFVIPSDFEGISNSMIEALAMGIPSISTDSPAYGARTFIKNGINGFLINVGDLNALVDRIEEIILNKEKRELLSINAYKINSILNVNSVVNQWEEMMKRVLNNEI